MAENNAAARREARRRRILENSEERLKRIAGNSRTTVKDGLCSSHQLQNGPVSLNSAVSEEKINDSSSDVHKNFNFEGSVLEPMNDIIEEEGTDTLSKLLASASEEINLQEKNVPQSATFLQSIQESRLHFVGIAVLVRLLFYCDCGFIFGESIFIPLLLFEVTDIVLMTTVTMKTPSSCLGGVVGTVLLLSGVTPDKAAVISKTLGLVSKVGKDFAVYFVSFVSIHCLLVWPG